MLASATLGAVKDATVVIVNPEHLATALRYVQGQDEAPTVVAAMISHGGSIVASANSQVRRPA